MLLIWINGIQFCKKVNYFVLHFMRLCSHCNMGANSFNTVGKLLNIVWVFNMACTKIVCTIYVSYFITFTCYID
jgi:hypothetical protein